MASTTYHVLCHFLVDPPSTFDIPIQPHGSQNTRWIVSQIAAQINTPPRNLLFQLDNSPWMNSDTLMELSLPFVTNATKGGFPLKVKIAGLVGSGGAGAKDGKGKGGVLTEGEVLMLE